MEADYNDRARALASRIAQRLTATDTPAATVDDVAELRAGLGQVLQRLQSIESRLTISPERKPEAGRETPKLHPSQEQFKLEPAVAELVDYLEGAKLCDFEPGHKPCDNCALCTARGF